MPLLSLRLSCRKLIIKSPADMGSSSVLAIWVLHTALSTLSNKPWEEICHGHCTDIISFPCSVCCRMAGHEALGGSPSLDNKESLQSNYKWLPEYSQFPKLQMICQRVAQHEGKCISVFIHLLFCYNSKGHQKSAGTGKGHHPDDRGLSCFFSFYFLF